jgi:hypothetical protein
MAVQPVERKLAAIFAADRNRSLPTFDASLDECRAERNGTPACDSMKAIGQWTATWDLSWPSTRSGRTSSWPTVVEYTEAVCCHQRKLSY